MVGSRALDDRVRLSHTSSVSVLTGRDFRIGSFFADLMVSTTRSVYPNEPFARRSRRNKAREDQLSKGRTLYFAAFVRNKWPYAASMISSTRSPSMRRSSTSADASALTAHQFADNNASARSANRCAS